MRFITPKIITPVVVLFFLLIPSLSAQIDRELFENSQKKVKSTPLKSSVTYPNLEFRVHKNSRFWNTLYNNGIIGNYFGQQDPDLQLNAPNFYFPRYSHYRHGYASALWVGGIIGKDTLVSTSMDVNQYYGNPYYFESEMWPDLYPFGGFKDLSASNMDDLSKSEVKYQAVYTDTFIYQSFVPYSNLDMRYHKPLWIEITQTSYSWSYKYAEDIMMLNYRIKNIGQEDISNAYIGLLNFGANYFTGELPYPKLDDIPGYIDSVIYEFPELGYEKLNIAWTIDHDGYPMGNTWYPMSTRDALGVAPLGLPGTAWNRSFNWWANIENRSWGPRLQGTVDDPLRPYHGDYGQPLTDKEKYHIMAHHEVDYDGYQSEVDRSRQGWIEPFEYAADLTDGFFVRYVTSVGPYDIPKGNFINVTFVMAIGENVHNIPGAYRNEFDPQNPQVYMTYLDFADLIDNVRWAKRIYDNPGVDTDNDGDSGKYVYVIDSLSNDSLKVFYEGDGVPDFRGATPPPPPQIRVTPHRGKVVVRWNGRDVENYFDTFSLTKDFEGYRVYLARSINESDIVLLATYDREDYNRYQWSSKYLKYELKETPFTIDQLRDWYGQDFDPLDYTRTQPFVINNNYYYFTKVDYNYSYLSDPNEIHKLYPDAINDTSDVDEEGRMRYYEYEYVIENLLPSVPYYITVTAFDFGHPAKSLTSLESSKNEFLVKTFAMDQGEDILKDGLLDVAVYPNPYRIDSRYDNTGYENRFSDLYEERARSIFFANIPNKCTISIYSIDGDLIRKIEHNETDNSSQPSVARFNLINRNDQTIVSGIYYWVVESEVGKQIGKLVVLR